MRTLPADRDGQHPNNFVEIYWVPSWEEHLRQHGA
jgi:hypothetical protein